MRDKVWQIMIDAGTIALDMQKNVLSSKKSDGSLVTAADLAVSKELESKLGKMAPVLSEENYNLDSIKGENSFFIIDPIDGTFSYERQEGSWTILISYIKDGVIESGFVYQPSEGTGFYAQKGSGVQFFSEGSWSTVSISPMNFVGVISPNKPDKEISFLKKNKIKEFNPIPTICLKVLDIVRGNSSIMANYNRAWGVWDITVPMILCNELGLVFECIGGFKIDYSKPLDNCSFVIYHPKWGKVVY